MTRGGEELEIKLCVSNLEAVREKLESLGATLTHPRRSEQNLRFDTPEGDLSRSGQALRLRQYEVAQMTYKGPSEFVEGVRSRQEIEFEVGDFEAARKLFEALGYRVFMVYEKYRTAYEIGGVEVSLDELPYGNFIEIEGPNTGKIRAIAGKLEVNWEARIPDSYAVLFERLRKRISLSFRDLTFENFKGLDVSPDTLGVQPADIR